MRASSWWIWLKGADHGFFMNGDCEAEQGLCGAARWNVDGWREAERTEMTLSWDREGKGRLD